MENEKISSKVVYEDEDTEEYEEEETEIQDEAPEETPEETPEEVLEKAGILSNGQVKEIPAPLTASQKQKEYKRKMTEKRLEALKKAREAKKAKRERMLKEKAEPRLQDGALPHLPRPQAEVKEKPVKQTVNRRQNLGSTKTQPKARPPRETDDERIERLVMEKLEKLKPKQSQPTHSNVKKETDEERIERLVQERLQKHIPKEPELTPKQKADLEEQAYLRKLYYGY